MMRTNKYEGFIGATCQISQHYFLYPLFQPCAIAIAFPWSEIESSCFDDETDPLSPGQLAFVKITLVSTNLELTEWIRYENI